MSVGIVNVISCLVRSMSYELIFPSDAARHNTGWKSNSVPPFVLVASAREVWRAYHLSFIPCLYSNEYPTHKISKIYHVNDLTQTAIIRTKTRNYAYPLRRRQSYDRRGEHLAML